MAGRFWLARICYLGPCRPSYVPPRKFRQLRQLRRCRRKLVNERRWARNRIQTTLDHDGLRLGGAMSDIFGRKGPKVLAGLAAGRSPDEMLAALIGHVRHKRELLGQCHKRSWMCMWCGSWATCRAHEAANASIGELDARMEQGVAEIGRTGALVGDGARNRPRQRLRAPWSSWGQTCRLSTRRPRWPTGLGWHPATTRVPASGARGACRRGDVTLRATLANYARGEVCPRGRRSTAITTRSRRICRTSARS